MTKILQYFAPCTLGLETALEQELEDLGAQAIATVPGGAKFAGDVRLGYAANLWLRSAIRVQELLCRFTAKSTDELYAVISDVDWSRYMAVDQTLAIYDTMQFMGCDLATYCIGQAASGAALILMAGAKGKRFILPNAKVMLHQPYGGITGQAEDIRIQADEVLRDKVRLNGIISKCTGRPVEKVTEDTERDRYRSAEEAHEYGIVDEILYHDDKDKEKKKNRKK